MRVEAQSADGTARYGSQLLTFSHIRLLKGPSDGFDGIRCLEKHILRLDLVWESFAAQELSGWKGPKHFDLLMTPRNATGMNASEKLKISFGNCFRRHPCGKSTVAMAFPRILP
jgi:hypothetical protein